MQWFQSSFSKKSATVQATQHNVYKLLLQFSDLQIKYSLVTGRVRLVDWIWFFLLRWTSFSMNWMCEKSMVIQAHVVYELPDR